MKKNTVRLIVVVLVLALSLLVVGIASATGGGAPAPNTQTRLVGEKVCSGVDGDYLQMQQERHSEWKWEQTGSHQECHWGWVDRHWKWHCHTFPDYGWVEHWYDNWHDVGMVVVEEGPEACQGQLWCVLANDPRGYGGRTVEAIEQPEGSIPGACPTNETCVAGQYLEDHTCRTCNTEAYCKDGAVIYQNECDNSGYQEAIRDTVNQLDLCYTEMCDPATGQVVVVTSQAQWDEAVANGVTGDLSACQQEEDPPVATGSGPSVPWGWILVGIAVITIAALGSLFGIRVHAAKRV